MPRSYRYFHYDVFTDHLFGGNQLAVILDGRGLSTDTMQAIAKEMNFSETTFVLPAEQAGTDARLRIFTPGEELPAAGHPTIGSTFALARAGVIEPGRAQFVFGLGVGPTPVTLTWTGEDLTFVWMTQRLPVFGDPIPDPAHAAAALSLSPAAVAGTGHPVQIVSCGVPFLFVPLTTRSAVDSAVVNGGALDASGPLGCYLVRHRIVPPEKADAILSVQGVKMGRPSHVHISIGAGPDGDISSVRVGGEAVLAGEGTLYV
ncbi:MAG: PhzF family phenazine biosynthesis protein [Acidobacteria bacterium]|nr:MAG: PhzF family phenazine biosynthesis protein [Acidobacteriota bacterium]